MGHQLRRIHTEGDLRGDAPHGGGNRSRDPGGRSPRGRDHRLRRIHTDDDLSVSRTTTLSHSIFCASSSSSTPNWIRNNSTRELETCNTLHDNNTLHKIDINSFVSKK